MDPASTQSAPLVPPALSDAPPSTLKYDIASVHPVQAALAAHEESRLRARRTLQAATFGSAFPMRRLMQESVLAQFHRAPGLPSSRLAFEVLNRRDADIDYEDYLSLPEDSPEGGPIDARLQNRDAIEKALGISIPPPF
jgi:hypothetical protein